MKKLKIASLLLAFAILLGLLPAIAFAADGDFNHIQFFRQNYQGNQVIFAIGIALTGDLDSLPLSDIKDFSVTRDGEPVDVSLVETDDILNVRNQWWSDTEAGTSFMFDLSEKLIEPGGYELSFTYKGQSCTGMHWIEDAESARQEAAKDAIHIGSEAELRAFAEAVNNGEYDEVHNPYAMLTNDIVLSDEWTPIGVEYDTGEGWISSHMFYGTFDGAGYKISGVKIGSRENPSELKYMGLFAFAPRNVFDLTLEVEFYAYADEEDFGTQNIGGLAARNGENFRNCVVSGLIEIDGDARSSVGGLLGETDMNSFVSDCSSSVTISSQSATVGGLIGSGGGSIINCYATGDVSGETAGGFIGISSGYIERCFATGNVTAKPRINNYGGTQYCMGSAGGFSGYISLNSEDDIISGCFASGDVTVQESGIDCNGGCNAGGFAGNISASFGSVENCYATGDVRGRTAGGFAADVMSPSPDGSWGGGKLSISHCFASGNVISETGRAAGFISSSIGAWVYDCASLGDVTAKLDAMGFASDFGYAGIVGCWSVGDVTSAEGVAYAFGAGTNCYAVGNVSGKDASGHVGEHSYFAGTLTAAPNDDGTPKTFWLGESSYADITLCPVGYDESVTTGKTTAEMQSQAFVDLLNAGLPDKPWRYKEGSYPVLSYNLLAVNISSSADGTLYAPPYASQGDEVIIFAVPSAGHRLKTLQYNGVTIDGVSFAMPEVDVTVTAEFEPLSAAGSETAAANNTVSSSNPSGSVPGSSVPGGSVPVGGASDVTDGKPINPAIYIGGGILLICILIAVVLYIASRKKKDAN